MGHDHVYTRTHVMKGQEVVTDTTNLKSVTDPDGIVYLTANQLVEVSIMILNKYGFPICCKNGSV